MAKAWVSIHCDATSRGNPGPSAWGATLQYGSRKKTVYGYLGIMSCNEAELRALLNSLKQLTKKQLLITIYSDSQYVAFGFQGKWKIKTHKQLWEEIFDLTKTHKEVIVNWIPREHNMRADRHAKKGLNQCTENARNAQTSETKNSISEYQQSRNV